MASLPHEMNVVVHLEPQPTPKPGTSRPTSHLVVEDMLAKYDAGAVKYGTQHQHDNGRDHLIDGYQEVLDLACYLRAEIEKRNCVPFIDIGGSGLNDQITRLRLEVAAAGEQIAGMVVERDEARRQVQDRVYECNRLITAQTKAISERDVAISELTVEKIRADVAVGTLQQLVKFTRGRYVAEPLDNGGWLLVEKKLSDEAPTDAPTPAPAGYVDERDHRRALAQLETLTKERDGAVHALGAAKSERDMARKSLGEAHHEVEAARKLANEGTMGARELALRRRCERGIGIIDVLGSKDTPAMKELRAVLTGEKP